MDRPATDRQCVAVANGNADKRRELTAAIRSIGVDVVGYNSAEAILQADHGSLSGMVLSLRLPEMSGVELHRQLIESGVSTPVILYMEDPTLDAAVTAMKQGAVDVVGEPLNHERLLTGIRQSLAMSKWQFQTKPRYIEARERLEQLTPRERQTLALMIVGYATKQIAAKLHVSEKTIESRRRALREKLNTESLAEMLVMAVAIGNRHCNGTRCCGLAHHDACPCDYRQHVQPALHTDAGYCPLAQTNNS